MIRTDPSSGDAMAIADGLSKPTDPSMLARWSSMLDERRKLTEFWDWLCEYDTAVADALGDVHRDKALDAFHGIDQRKLERERRELLAKQREVNNAMGFALAWEAIPDDAPEHIADAVAAAAIASCGEAAHRALQERGWHGGLLVAGEVKIGDRVRSIDPTVTSRDGTVVEIAEREGPGHRGRGKSTRRIRVAWDGKPRTWLACDAEGKRWCRIPETKDSEHG